MFKRLQHIIVSLILLFSSSQGIAQMAMPDTVCVGATKTYQVNPGNPAGSTYTWKVAGVTQSSNTNQLQFTWNTTGIFLVEVQEHGKDGCDGDPQSGLVVVNNGKHTDTTVIACNSFTWDRTGQIYTSTGNYDYFSTNAQGCPDTLTLNLTINRGTQADTTVIACDKFIWNRTGQTYTTTGDYDYFGTNALGCPDTVTLKLTINKGSQVDTTVIACDKFIWNRTGQTYTTSGDFNYFSTNAQGCPDTLTLKLTINRGTQADTVVIACDEFIWNRTGQTYTTTGDYDYFGTNALGCPDTVTLKLTINKSSHTYQQQTSCVSYIWTSGTGSTYTASGNYDHITTNANGCKDTVTLNLTINPLLTKTDNITVCPNQRPYTWYGTSYNTAGTFTTTVPSTTGGCDTVATLNLSFTPFLTKTDNVIICSNQVPYLWYGNSYNASGTYNVTVPSSTGTCDTTATLNLTINKGTRSDTAVIACDKFIWNRTGQTYTSTGDYDYFGINALGCPDTVTLKLTINKGTRSDTTVIACDKFVWNRTGQTYTSTGDYDYFGINALGCPDTVTLKLTVNKGTRSDTTVIACDKFIWNWTGQTYTSTGDYDYFGINVLGCPDTITLKLTVNKGTRSDTTVIACDNFVWNRTGQTYTSTGDYDYLGINALGCPDTVTLKLTINKGTRSDTTVIACDKFIWNRTGQTYTTTGDYDYFGTNALGCPDTVTLKLTINKGTRTDTTVIACDKFVWNRTGQTYTSTGDYDYFGTNALGCPDTVILKLTINIGIQSDTSVIACNSFTWNRTSETYTQSGDYNYYSTGANGCPDTLTLKLTISTLPVMVTHGVSTCTTADLTAASVTQGSDAGLTFTYYSNSAATVPLSDPAAVPPGTYYIKGTSASGCVGIKSVEVTASSPPNLITNTVSTCTTADLTAASITQGSDAGLTFTYYSNAAATVPVSNPAAVAPGTYYIKGTTADGCVAIKSVDITATSPPNLITNPVSTCTTADLTAASITQGSDAGLTFTYYSNSAATVPVNDPAAVAPGTYYIRGTTADGCVAIKSVDVTVTSPPNMITNAVSTCSTADLTAASITQGSDAGLTFTYYTNSAATVPVNNPSAVAPGTYYIRGTTGDGCVAIKSVDVTALPLPASPTTTVTDPTCTTPTGTIAVTSSTTGLEFSLDAAAYAAYPAGGYTGVASGSHTLSVRNTAGCSVTVNVSVASAPGAPASPTTTVTDPTCTTPTGTIAVTSSTTGLEFSLDGAAYAAYPAGGYTGVASGSHTLSVRNTAGCSVTVNVSVASAPGAPASPTTTVTDPTCTTPTGTIAVTSSTTGLEFSLDAAAYAAYPAGGYTGVASGSHTLSVRNTAGCSVTVNVSVASAPGAPASPTTTVTDPTCTTPTGTIAVTSSTTGLEFSLDAAAYAAYPAGGYTGVASGSHTLSVRNTAGCSVTVNVSVASAPGAPASPTTTVIDPTCTTPTGTIAVTSSTTGLEFSLDGAAYAAYPAGGYTGVASGSHTLSVRNTAGCSVTVNVSVASAPGAPASPTTTVTDPTCTTPTGTIAVTSSTTGLEFSLDGAAYAAYPAGGYTGVASGSHTLSVRNTAGCSVTVNVSVASAPGAPASPTTTVTDPTCTTPTGSIAVTSSTTGLEFSLDAAAYAAYPAGGYTGVASGSHTLSVRNTAGCSVTVNVSVASAPGAPASPTTTVTDPTCTTPTGTIAVTSSTTGLEFSLDAAAYAAYPAGGYTGVASGSHTLSVRNTAGCSVTVNVSVASAPGAPASPTTTVTDPTCTTPAGTIAVTSSTTGLEFSLDAAAYAAYPAGGYTGVASGSHTLSVRNTAGCSVTVNVSVASAPGAPATPTTTVTDPTCTTPTGTIAVTSSTTGLEFSLDGAAYAAYPAGGYTGVASGSHTLSVRNTAGCSVTVNVSVASAPGAPASPATTVTDPTCTTPTGTIAVTSSTTGLEFSLDAAAYAAYPAGGYTGVASGSHTLSVRNTAGCSVTVNVSVASAPGAPATPTTTVTDPTCTTPTGTIAVTSSTTGLEFSLDAAAYAAYPAGGYTGVASGSHTLSVRNTAGCSVTVNVSVASAPGAPASPTTTVTDPTCTTPTGTIAVTSSTTGLEFSLDAAAYAAYPAGGYTGVASGSHTLSVRNTAGCSVTVNVSVASAPGAPATPTTTVTDPTCTTPTGTIAVTSSTTGLEFSLDAAAYAAYPAGGYTGVASGSHTLSVRNTAGCSVTVNVSVASAPGAPATPTTTVTDPTCTTPTGTIAVTSSTTGLEFSLDGAAYAAYPAGGYTGVASGSHTLSVRNTAGCSVTVNVSVASAPGAPASPTVTVSNNCATSTLTAGNIQLGASILWSNGATGNSITVNTGGTYTVTQTINGCTSQPGSGTASPDPAPTATVSGGTFCATGTTTLTTTGATGGTFSATPAGLSINATTGVIDLAASAPNTYTVTYSFGTAPCNGTANSTVIVNSKPVVDKPQNITSCASYTLPALTNGNYYSSPNGVGPIAAGTVITATQTIYVYAGSAGCSDEHSFVVTITNKPVADAPADVTACASYTLPALTNGNYFASSGGVNPIAVGTVITTSQTVYVYAGSSPACSDEHSFNITITPRPVADAPQNVTSCASYILPPLNVGAYFSAPNGAGPIAVGTAVTSTQTVYVYAGTAACFTQNSFAVTITNKPVADDPADITACASYTLPALTNGSYFSSPNGVGPVAAGTVLTSTQTLYVYAGSAACFDEHSFVVNITQRPPADAPQNVTSCASYTLPALTNGNYFSAPNGTGPLAAGTVLTSTQTVYVYAGTAACFTQNSFTVTITNKPVADDPADVTACASYTLPALTNGSYFSSPGGVGPVAAGTVLTSTQTLYVYAGSAACFDEHSFVVNITQRPPADAPQNVTSCASYTLPALTNGNYFSAPNGTGPLAAGTVLTTSQTVYVYAGTAACFTQNSFTVTITNKPVADDPADVTACASYTLPALTNGSYFTSPNGVGPIAAGTVLTSTQTLYVYAGSAACSSENSFTVTITPRPGADAPQNVTSCASYTLPALTNGNYFSSPNGTGPIAAGTVLTTSQTVYVYAGTAACFTQNSFTVTITSRPVADAPANVDRCGSYTLPALANGAYYSSPNGVGPIAAGTVISTTQTIYVYAGTAFCFDEHSFNVTITPVVTPTVSIATPSTSICLGVSATFTATVTNPGSAPAYQWQLNGTNIAGANSLTYTTSTLSNGDKITFTMVSNAPCATVTNITSNEIIMAVTSVTPAVSITASTTTICAGFSITFNATPVNGGAAPQYQWQINGTDVAGATSSSFTTTTLNNGDKVTVVMTSNAACTTTPFATSNQVPIVVNPLPVVVITDPAGVCFPATVDITLPSVTAGSDAGLTYTYFTDAAATAPLSNPKAIGTTGTYYIKGTTAAGCITVMPVRVTINPLPNLVITNPAAVCSPNTVDITAAAVTAGSDAGITLTYYTDAAATSVLNNPNAVNASGTYYIKATTIFGCVTVKPVIVIIHPLPTATISGSGAICRGDSKSLPIVLTGTGPFTVTYSDGTSNFTVNGINASPYFLVVSPTVNTTYTLVSVTDANCSNTATGSAVLTVGTPIPAVRYTTVNATANLPKQLQARNFTPGDQYTWDPAVGLNAYTIVNPIFNYDKTTEYLITIAAGTGCTVVDTVLVNVFPASAPPSVVSSIFVPKAWSPNGDGHNDKLTPLLFRIKDLYYFRIFNRWGQLVYETKNRGEGWDGVFKGQKQGADVFTWIAAGLGEDGRTHNVRGQSVLLR